MFLKNKNEDTITKNGWPECSIVSGIVIIIVNVAKSIYHFSKNNSFFFCDTLLLFGYYFVCLEDQHFLPRVLWF